LRGALTLAWLGGSAAAGTAEEAAQAPTGSPREWGADDVQRWFQAHKQGKWAEYAPKFAELTGEQMSALSKEDFLRFADSPYGSAIYNDWRALVNPLRATVSPHTHALAGTLTLSTCVCVRVVAHAATADVPAWIDVQAQKLHQVISVCHPYRGPGHPAAKAREGVACGFEHLTNACRAPHEARAATPLRRRRV
jgi:hypothetical protein